MNQTRWSSRSLTSRIRLAEGAEFTAIMLSRLLGWRLSEQQAAAGSDRPPPERVD
jgi:hypothetical protein